MAISANSVFEVRTAGSDVQGGGFVTGAAGTDYSQTDTKRTATGADDSTTDAVAAGTTTITSLTAVFGTTIVGNIVYFQGGTGAIAATWRQVTARASTTSITIDAAIAASTGMTMNIGGALASPGQASGIAIAENIIWIKAGTYTITSATPAIAGGCLGSTVSPLYVQGYQTTRGDLGTQPLLQASGITTFALVSLTGVDSQAANIAVDGIAATSSRGFLIRGSGYNLLASNCTNNGIVGSASILALHNCRTTGCSTQPSIIGASCVGCVCYNNTVTAISLNVESMTALRCICDTNTGASSDGILTNSDAQVVSNCVCYGNGRDGIRLGSGDNQVLINNICESNTGGGINVASRTSVRLVNNTTYLNTGGAIINATGKGVANSGAVAATGSLFTDAPNQDFTLNNTAGAGADARAAGFPGALTVGGTGYLDRGALQHQDSGGGSAGGGSVFGSEGGVIT